MRFDGVHAFGYNSAGSEPIFMKFGLDLHRSIFGTYLLWRNFFEPINVL